MSVSSVLLDPHYSKLKEFVLEHTGLHYYAERDEDLATRLARRMAATGAPNCQAYSRLLAEDDRHAGGELDALIGEITIGETYFFRQAAHFDLLRTVIIPDLIVRNQNTRRIRIWSAGCATGAEPYSLSLLLGLEFREQLRNWNISILGTDINTDFLAQARTARFGAWALREVPEGIRQRCFRQEGRSWVLAPEFRENVRFEYHNLVSGTPYPGSADDPLHIIMCRNVMIYFSQQRIRNLAQRFYESLDAGGWLLVGHAEPSTASFPEFEVVSNDETTAYRKFAADASPRTAWTQPALMPARVEPPALTVLFEARPPHPIQPARVESGMQEVPMRPPADTTTGVEQVRALADKGEWKSAENLCRQILEKTPLDAAAHFTLALVLEHIGTSDDAQASLRRAIYLDRAFVLAHYHLGLLLLRNGHSAQARKAFSNVLELLRSTPEDEVIPHGDGIRAGELKELAAMHAESAGRR